MADLSKAKQKSKFVSSSTTVFNNRVVEKDGKKFESFQTWIKLPNGDSLSVELQVQLDGSLAKKNAKGEEVVYGRVALFQPA